MRLLFFSLPDWNAVLRTSKQSKQTAALFWLGTKTRFNCFKSNLWTLKTMFNSKLWLWKRSQCNYDLLFFTVHQFMSGTPSYTGWYLQIGLFFLLLVINVNRDMPQSFLLPLFSRFWSHAWPNGLRANTLRARNHIFNWFKWPTRNSCCAFQVVCEARENEACFRFFPKLQLASSLRVTGSFPGPFTARPRRAA